MPNQLREQARFGRQKFAVQVHSLGSVFKLDADTDGQ